MRNLKQSHAETVWGFYVDCDGNQHKYVDEQNKGSYPLYAKRNGKHYVLRRMVVLSSSPGNGYCRTYETNPYYDGIRGKYCEGNDISR
ncbi:hypothetical protein [Halomarina litorea]|uniref:hypothetical protein n=1 Tax=Halomarina litorea TaxID=2961595 RepID=UPI0020C4B7AD|nr:hypothetical protein [Halomarina sp. BCD28]